MECGVGAGVLIEQYDLKLSFRLPDYASVFQAETFAIKEAVSYIKKNVPARTQANIPSDSQAAIQALSSTSVRSLLVDECRRELAYISDQYEITLIWVPGHRGIYGNEEADELARSGSALNVSHAVDMDASLREIKTKITEVYYSKAMHRWNCTGSYRITRQFWVSYEPLKTKDLLGMSKIDAYKLTAVCTGHWPVGVHAKRIGLPFNRFCRSCDDQSSKETIEHLLCECPALAGTRLKTLGKPFLQIISERSSLARYDALKFIKAAKWL